MSRDAALYRLADGVGLLGLDFINSRFLAPGLIVVVLQLLVVSHKAWVPVVFGASALRTSQRVRTD